LAGFQLPLQTDGSKVAANARRVPGSYLSITRSWRAGDRMELTMPMRLTTEPLRDDPGQLAFLYGPLVLAGQFGEALLEPFPASPWLFKQRVNPAP
jgi:DUF1680 family protein